MTGARACESLPAHLCTLVHSEICKQTTPGGQCTPGLAECDIEGFACQVSADSDVFRCLPNYNTDMNAADRAVCEAQHDPMLAALAKADGETFAYSSGSAAAAVASTSYGTGTVYGEDGEYMVASFRLVFQTRTAED